MPKIPEKLAFLLEPSTRHNRRQYSVMYGGRGGLKSYGAADAALIRGVQQFERVLCCRETMKSIRDSTHYLLKQRIYDLGLQDHYEVLEHTIRGPEHEFYSDSGNLVRARTEFIFAGLKHNPDEIRSLQRITIAIVEEAANVSDESWETLLPTVRWEDPTTGREAEVWIMFNPRFSDDATYKRWIINPPPTAKIVNTSWRDAAAYGFFPDVLRSQMEHMRETDHEKFLHVWEGQLLSALRGAIYSNEYKAAFADGRICSVPYNRQYPVHTYWDLGESDKTAIWFVQQIGPMWNFIDYLEDSQRPLSHYVIELGRKGYVYGTDHLPWDGIDALLHSRLTQDRSKSPEMVLKGLGRKPKVCPKYSVITGINTARELFPLCRFDETNCSEGLKALQMYQWGPPAATGQERTKPLHDTYSHGADAFRTFAVSQKGEKPQEWKPAYVPQPQYARTHTGWMR